MCHLPSLLGKWKMLKYGNGSTEVKRLVPRLFLFGRGAQPIHERSACPCLVLSWFMRLSKGWLSPSKVRKWEEKSWEWHLSSNLETGSWDLVLQRASLSCHLHVTVSGQTQPKKSVSIPAVVSRFAPLSPLQMPPRTFCPGAGYSPQQSSLGRN